MVLLQLRVGGQAARQRDETWPLECGCVGQETTGAGGLAKALRTVPIVLDIADRARQRADPGAWIIDFTNPVGIVTRALLDAGHRAVGLCNVAIGFQRLFARLLGTGPDQVLLDHVGLNHLTWERAVMVDGTDRLPELIAAHGEEIASHTGLPASVLHDVGAVPSYYLRYFWAHDAVVAEERTRPTRAEEVAAIEQELLAMYADPDLDHKPALLSERGGAFYSEAAVALLASLVGDTGDTQVVNVRNAGTFPFLDADAVIEVPAVIGADGPRPVLAAPLPPLMRGLVAHVSAYEELAVDAALRGGRDRVADRAAGPSPGRPARPGRRPDRPPPRREPRLPPLGQCWPGGRPPLRSPGTTPGTPGPRESPGETRLRRAPPRQRVWVNKERPAVLAIDGGNSKTDIALVAADGTLLASGRGPGVRTFPTPEVLASIGAVIGAAALDAGLPGGWPVAAHTVACMANADLPEEEERLAGMIAAAGLEQYHRGRQRHVRGAPGGPGHARRPPVGRGGHLRRRDQLPGCRPGRADHRVPRAGRHHRRLGRRLRPRPRRAVVGDARRGRPGSPRPRCATWWPATSG